MAMILIYINYKLKKSTTWFSGTDTISDTFFQTNEKCSELSVKNIVFSHTGAI